jgi:hypothetical protein
MPRRFPERREVRCSSVAPGTDEATRIVSRISSKVAVTRTCELITWIYAVFG